MTSDSMPPERPQEDAPVATPAPVSQPSPGEMIRKAREARGMGLEAFAGQIKLSRPTLDALERDDFAALLEPVYVRGYYRKCAKVLELDETQLLAAYAARVKPEAPRMPAKIRLSPSKSDGGWVGRLLGIALLIGVVAVALFLWFDRGTVPSSGVPAAPEAAVAVNPVLSPLATPDAMGADAADGTAGDGDAAPQSASETEPVSPAPTSAPSAIPEPATVPGEIALTLRFRETSWVRINDASGSALMNGLMNPGQTQQVRGTAPISVFLGNAPGVELTADGTAIDLTPHTQSNNTARLSLPVNP